jgi:predicted transcriptional regulator
MDSIQFLTRKGATCSELLGCIYGLKPIELEIFFELARAPQATVDDVSRAVGRDRTTTHRCLSKLVSAGLAYKQARGLKDGGYFHVYSAVETQRIKQQAELRVKEIADGLQVLIDNFEADLQRRLERAQPLR